MSTAPSNNSVESVVVDPRAVKKKQLNGEGGCAAGSVGKRGLTAPISCVGVRTVFEKPGQDG